MDTVGAVAVVGGGVSGIYAAHELAESGFKVYLIDERPTIGGRMLLLDKTFPTNDCAMCILSPKMVEVARHQNIEILTLSELLKIEGSAGNFQITLLHKPRYITENCNACGNCTNACPVEVPNEFEQGLTWRRAIYIPIPQAIPTRYVIDRKSCLGVDPDTCARCKRVCRSDAIDYNQKEKVVRLDVGSIILACGAETYDPSLQTSYNYRHKNVITSMEFERMMSASGPTVGEIIKPSDGLKPKRIAFIQCVGSRDPSRLRELCSAVCCMYATKEAIVAKEHDPELDITIFFIDLRAHGKGFEEFTNRAKELGIKYIRCEIPEVVVNEDTQNLTVLYEDPTDNQLKDVDLDLVVLSVGLTPSEALSSFQDTIGLRLDRFGYADTALATPVETSIPGVFVCGTSQGPKDIPDSVVQASAAAAKAEVLLSPVRNQLVRPREYPDEKEIGEEPRIGVFVCHCGINIGSIVDVPEVVEYVKTLPFVVYAERNLYTCSQDTQEKIKAAMSEHDLNRVVVASCTPRTHEPLFQNTLREAGLNPYLFEFCNIREQCSWVHMREKKRATEKAKDLLRMAVSRARLLRPLKTQQVSVVKNALVIGGGIAGMTSSLDIADQGFQVYMVEKQNQLGGFLHNIGRLHDGTATSEILESITKRVETHPKIRVFKESEVTDVSGFVGNFRAKINTQQNTKEIQFGAAIIAIGADVLMPKGYFHFGENRGIITQKELEARIDANFRAKKVVMIQCVGSREEKRPYCSRVCCTEAIKNSIRIKHVDPNTEVYLLYRDIRAYGLWETLYREARDLGVVFLRYDEENKPSVNPNDLTVEMYEPLFHTKLKLNADVVVLGSAITPPRDAETLSKMFKVPRDENGFFLEAHMKLRPVDFATEGVFVCGTAHYPKMIHESIAQASAAASRACMILAKDSLESEAAISLVDEEKCKGCGECTDVCPFEAIELQPEEMILEKVKFLTRKAHINPIICKGCGSCAVVCPVGAITPEHFTKQQIEASLEAAVTKTQ